MTKQKLLIATHNPGKLLEYKEIFKELKLPIKIISLKDLNIKQKLKKMERLLKKMQLKKQNFIAD